MKFIVALIGMMILSFLAGLYLPWWSMVGVCFVFGIFLKGSGLQHFLCGLVAIFLLWGLGAGWYFHTDSYIIANRMGDLFGGINGALMMLVTAILGGLMGGLGALSGGYFRGLFR